MLIKIITNPIIFSHILVEEGAIEPLVQLACCAVEEAQAQALAALRGIAISIEHRQEIVKEVR